MYCGYNDFISIPASSLLTLVFIVPRLSAVSHTEFDLSVQHKRTVVVVPMVVYQPNMFSCQSAQDITHSQTEPCPANTCYRCCVIFMFDNSVLSEIIRTCGIKT